MPSGKKSSRRASGWYTVCITTTRNERFRKTVEAPEDSAAQREAIRLVREADPDVCILVAAVSGGDRKKEPSGEEHR